MLRQIGKSNGHFDSKENRAQKLINKWDRLEKKMVAIIKRGKGISLNARCAYGILLTMQTGIRAGNETSAEGYICNQKYHKDFGKPVQTYGLITLLPKHLRLVNGKLYVSFLGKKAVKQSLFTQHPVLLHFYPIIRNHSVSNSWKDFLAITYGNLRWFTSRYIGKQFSPKDIRTAFANIKFVDNLRMATIPQILPTDKPRKKMAILKRHISSIIELTAEEIGHTKGVCKKSYLSGNLLQYCMDKLQGE